MFKFDFWTIIGFSGSALYFSRLLVQWFLSEKAGKPVIPAVYWYMSVGGALILTIYSFARKDPVILLNYIVPLAIYIRQIVLHQRAENTAEVENKCPECGYVLEKSSN
ncbi:MAG: lipid-A-disaccharide synthase N-terminal domain-containing protein [Planctomycetota bacterium]|jgi:lipid-A-disaccharide synthase-like uncharacterized protein